MKSFRDKNVLITGGASGIGRIMGGLLLEQGASLIIWDINDMAIKDTVDHFASLYLGKVAAMTVDIGDPAQVTHSAKKVLDQYKVIHLLINNAGIVRGKLFREHSLDDIQKTMEINSLAPMIVTRAFLPAMINSGSGHVCTIASSAGLTSNPRMSVYAASKWAAVGWSDSLRLEMKMEKLPIGVTTVTPYYISTGMFDGVRSPLIPILDPVKTAKRIIRGIQKNKIYVSMPWSVRFVRLSQGLMPQWMYDWVTGEVLGIYHTMDHFKGRG